MMDNGRNYKCSHSTMFIVSDILHWITASYDRHVI